MNYATFHLTSMVDSCTPIRVYPTHDFSERMVDVPAHHRLQGGRGVASKTPGSAVYEVLLPLTWVTSAQRADLTRWWADGRQVLLTYNLSGSPVAPQSLVMRLIGEEEPLTSQHKANAGSYFGAVSLIDARGVGKTAGGPFILEDAVWGVLDGTANLLQ